MKQWSVLLALLLGVSSCEGKPSFKRIYAFGDSIVLGVGGKLVAESSFQNNYYGFAQMVSRSLNLPLENWAVRGSRLEEPGQIDTILKSKPGPETLVLFMTGYNDMRTRPGATLEKQRKYELLLHQVLDHLTRFGATVLVGNCPRMTASGYHSLYAEVDGVAHGDDRIVSQYNERIGREVRFFRKMGRKISLVDVASHYDPVVHVDSDQVHPNLIGHQRIAELFLSAM